MPVINTEAARVADAFIVRDKCIWFEARKVSRLDTKDLRDKAQAALRDKQDAAFCRLVAARAKSMYDEKVVAAKTRLARNDYRNFDYLTED